jgi:hypothetical protein
VYFLSLRDDKVTFAITLEDVKCQKLSIRLKELEIRWVKVEGGGMGKKGRCSACLAVQHKLKTKLR